MSTFFFDLDDGGSSPSYDQTGTELPNGEDIGLQALALLIDVAWDKQAAGGVYMSERARAIRTCASTNT